MDFRVDFFFKKVKWGASIEKLQSSSIQHVTCMRTIGAGNRCDLLGL